MKIRILDHLIVDKTYVIHYLYSSCEKVQCWTLIKLLYLTSGSENMIQMIHTGRKKKILCEIITSAGHTCHMDVVQLE